MPSNPFDQFLPQGQTQPPSSGAVDNAPSQAAPAAAENPFSQFVAKPSAPAASVSEDSTPQAIPQTAAQGSSNPFAQFVSTSAAPAAAQPAGVPGQTPSYEDRFGTGESFLSRPLTTYFGIPEYREGATGVEKGVEKTLSGLTSPVSLGLLLATSGSSALETAAGEWLAEEGGEAAAKGFGEFAMNWAEKNLGEGAVANIAKVTGAVNKVASVGFAYDQIRGVASAVPQVMADLKAGDHDSALEHLTEAGIGAVFAAGMVSHVKSQFLGDKFTYVPDKEALGLSQGDVERGNLAVRNIEKTAKDLNLTSEENIALKEWMNAGGAKSEVIAKPEPKVEVPSLKASDTEAVPPGKSSPVRDTPPLNPYSANKGEVVVKPTEEGGSRIEHAKGSMELVSPDEKTVQVKGVMAAEKGVGQRLYDTAIENAVNGGAEKFKSDTVRTEDGEAAWERLSHRYDVIRESDGSYSIDLTKLRKQAEPEQLAAPKEQAAVPEEGAPKPDTMAELRSRVERVRTMTHLPPEVRERKIAALELAQRLRPEVKQLGTVLSNDYHDRWNSYKEHGLVHDDAVERENYAGSTRYEPNDETRNAYRPSEGRMRATKKPTSLKGRSFQHDVEAMEHGFVPKNTGAIDSYSDYVRQHAGATGIAKAEQVFLNKTDVDGRPVAINPASIRHFEIESATGKKIRVPMVPIMDTSHLDAATIENKVRIEPDGKAYLDVSDYSEGPKQFSRNRVTEVGYKQDPMTKDVMRDSEGNPVEMPIMKKTALFFHPDQIEQVRKTFEDDSWVRKTPWANAILKTSQASKSFLLSLSPFHLVTEGLRGLQMGLNLNEIFHPKEIEADSLAMTKGVDHGLTLHPIAERSGYEQGKGEGVGATGPLFQKIPVLGNIQKWGEDRLFGSYIPKLKAVAFEKIETQLREQNPNWEDHQIYSQAGRITNGIFGGLNWKQLGVSANTVDTLRMIALAPDFTGSQLDSTLSMFKPGGSIVAQSFGRMAMYNILVAQTLNLLIHGQVRPDHPFSVVDSDGKRSWGMRTMPEDTWRALTQPQSFFRNRMNPVAKTAYETLYGRDDQGKRLSDEQLVGDAIRNVMPLSLQSVGSAAVKHFAPQMYGKFKTGTAEDQFYDSLARGVGMSPSVNRTPAETMASQRLNDRLPAGVADPSAVARHHKMLDLEDQMRAGKSVDLRGLTPSQMRQVMTSGREDLLVSKFGRLNMSDKLDVWRAATAEEKKKLLPGLMKERNSVLKKLSPIERENDETFQRMKAVGLVK